MITYVEGRRINRSASQRQNMAFDVYSDMILTRDVIERGLHARDIGTVVERHSGPGVTEEGYSVEVMTATSSLTSAFSASSKAMKSSMLSSSGRTVST